MKVYGEFEPEKIMLHGIAMDGAPISIPYYLSSNKKYVYQNHESAMYEESDCRRCNVCGNLTENKQYIMCNACVEKKGKNRYMSLPEVPFTYPCFVDDEFIEDEDCMDDYLENHEECIPTEIYPAIKKSFSLDLIDYIDENLELEDSFSDLLTDSQNALFAELEEKINNLISIALTSYYDCDMKHRMTYITEEKK